MKLNKISMVIAAMAFVGCSSDDFNLSSNKTVDESGMIQLDENFVIAGVGEEGAATRTHWEWNNPVTQDYLINKFFPEIPFVAVLGNRSGFPLKPDPEIVEEVLQRAKVTRAEAIMTGDSPTDMKTAANGGIDRIAVSWGYRPMKGIPGLRVAESAEQILDLFSLITS